MAATPPPPAASAQLARLRWPVRVAACVVCLVGHALLGACTGLSPSSEPYEVGPYDPMDGATVRLHDLILRDEADLRALSRRVVQVVRGQWTDPLGNEVVTIRSTGLFASGFSALGFEPRGHLTVQPEPSAGLGVRVESLPSWPACNSIDPVAGSTYVPSDDAEFPWFDPDPSGTGWGGLAAEFDALHDPPNFIQVATIATTGGGRDVKAIRIGPTASGAPPYPTVFVIGTQHAREWVSLAVTRQLLEYFVDTLMVPGHDSELAASLETRAVVFVPMMNPDGYQYSRTVYRDQRMNRRSFSCSPTAFDGVDLNRNHSTSWNEPNSGTSGAPCSIPGIYAGPSAASEPETIGLENLLSGMVPLTSDLNGTVLLNYHTFGEAVIYPQGYLESAPVGATTPACKAFDGSNCLPADMLALRNLFGDYRTAPPVFTDAAGRPWTMDFDRAAVIPVSGDVATHALVEEGMLSATIEMQSYEHGFYTECDPSYTTLVASETSSQLNLLRSVVLRVDDVLSPDKMVNSIVGSIGELASGFWTREYASPGEPTRDSNTARPRWTKAVFNPPGGASPTLSASINGVPTTMDKYREGALYTLYKFDNPGTGLCVPRSFQYGENAADGEGIGCTDLCDPSRIPMSGWSHRSGSRGGSLDCWYEPNPSVGATLTLPGAPTGSATHCTLMFSLDIPVFSEGDRIVLERADGAGGWDVIRFWPTDDDYGNDATGTFPFVTQVHSYVVELPVDPRPAHRFRVDGVGSLSGVGSIDLFDPLIYCRYGPLR